MLRVTVSCSPAPREVFEAQVQLAPGATVRDAVTASGLVQAWPQLDWSSMQPGIWGRAATWEQPLADLDRVELCRALTVDPKTARRERFRQQGARGAGLFANRRKGGKAGY